MPTLQQRRDPLAEKAEAGTDILLKSAIYVELSVGSQFLEDERLLIRSGTLARVANRVKSLISSLCTLEQPFYWRRHILDFTSGGIDPIVATLGMENNDKTGNSRNTDSCKAEPTSDGSSATG